MKSKILAIIVFAGYLALILIGYRYTPEKGKSLSEHLISFSVLFMYLLLAMSCIFFGDRFGAWIGSYRSPEWAYNSEVPTVIFIGWILLLLPIIVTGLYLVVKRYCPIF